MAELKQKKLDCAIAEWIYPLGNGCYNALIAIGRNSSDDFEKLRHLRGKKFRFTTENISPECQTCPVMTTYFSSGKSS